MYQLDICPEYIVTHFSELSTLSRRLKICPNGSKIDKVKGLSLYLMPYNWKAIHQNQRYMHNISYDYSIKSVENTTRKKVIPIH